MSYATFSDCERYLEGFGTAYYGTYLSDGSVLTIGTLGWQNDLEASFDKINTLLDSIQRVPIVPVGTNVKSGRFHPYLIEWNARDTIFVKMQSRHSPEYQGRLPEWMTLFKERTEQIFNEVLASKIALDTDTTPRGIGYPVAGTRTGRATFCTNWNSGFYTFSDYQKLYKFWVIGTTDGNLPGQAQYVVSHDDGYSWESGTRVTGTTWQSIEYGLEVRWENAGTLYGTQLQVEVGDMYKVTCIPVTINSINSGAVVKKFRRG